MAYIGYTPDNFETIEDRKTHTGDGTRTVFGVLFSDSNVSVFQNGVKLKETADYTVDSAGTYITMNVAPSSGDIIDLIGFNAITSLAQSSYIRETFTSSSNQSVFTLATNIAAQDDIIIHVNGVRIQNADYTTYTSNNTITFSESFGVGEVIDFDVVTAGFRSGNHNAKSEKATHQSFANPATQNTDFTVPSTENAMLVGPVTINSDITVEGTLTIV